MSSQRTFTARAKLVAALTQDILSKDEQSSFAIASEHQLCRRFNVSRVTVRLALSDLENRGLIYRKHGKGTFAHGRTTRIHRYLGILLKSQQSAGHRPVAEMLRGVQTVMASLRSAILMISTPPEAWRAEKASSLGGVIVVPSEVTERDLEVLRDRNLPYLLFTETGLVGPTMYVGQKKAARHLTERLLREGHRQIAVLSGYDAFLDDSKRQGIHEALTAAGINPATVREISAQDDESQFMRAARDVLNLSPRPTAVVAMDDSLASILSFHARRIIGLRVPEDLSIVSFHDWPYLNYVEPSLATVHFDFFAAGRKAAEVISGAALTGDNTTDFYFEPVYRDGQTVGPAPR